MRKQLRRFIVGCGVVVLMTLAALFAFTIQYGTDHPAGLEDGAGMFFLVIAAVIQPTILDLNWWVTIWALVSSCALISTDRYAI